MGTRRHALLVILLGALGLALSAGGCTRGPVGRPPPDAGPEAPPRFKPPGRCFGKTSKCASDAQCGPPFSTCQEGACCSGTLDPETCVCRCGAGPECRTGELCCPGTAWTEEGSRGVLKCRPLDDCFGPLH